MCSLHAVIAAWLKAFPRSQICVGMNKSASCVKYCLKNVNTLFQCLSEWKAGSDGGGRFGRLDPCRDRVPTQTGSEADGRRPEDTLWGLAATTTQSTYLKINILYSVCLQWCVQIF